MKKPDPNLKTNPNRNSFNPLPLYHPATGKLIGKWVAYYDGLDWVWIVNTKFGNWSGTCKTERQTHAAIAMHSARDY